MPRHVVIPAPFTGGMTPDLAAYQIGLDQSERAQDLIAPNFLATQRKGWVYDGAANTNFSAETVFEAKFVLADVTRIMLTGDLSGFPTIKIHGGNTVEPTSLAENPIPRAIYRDELFFCFSDGQTPMRRYSGADTASDTATADWVANTATFVASGGTWPDVDPGWYLYLARPGFPTLWLRVLEKSSNTSITLEDVRATVAAGATLVACQGVGSCFPCVKVYEAGTASITSNVVTGSGTKWQNGSWGAVLGGSDAFQSLPVAGSSRVSVVESVTDDDTIAVTHANASNINYAILRPPPFTDVAVHKNSLCGTGVAQYPNRVYIAPPGWNPSLPPGYVPPMDPTIAFSSATASNFQLGSVDIPTSWDGDANVALLSTENPLAVLKQSSARGIYGVYPDFEQALLPDGEGAGTIDRRSAWNLPGVGPVWAGPNGIHQYVGGRVIDLTDRRINREWRALVADFDFGVNDYCCISEAEGFLIVSIKTGGGATQRTYVYDWRARVWPSRFTNHDARFMHASRQPGRAARLLWVSGDEPTRVMDSAPVLNLSGLAKDADGTAPRMQGWTSKGLVQSLGIVGEANVTDLVVSANVYDQGAAGATKLVPSVVSSGGLGQGGTETTATLDAINSDAVDLVDWHEREVNRTGRLHQVRIDVSTLGTNDANTKVEVAQLTIAMTDTAAGT